MDQFADRRFLEAALLIALIFVVLTLLLLRARSRRRAEQRPMRIRLTEDRPGEEP